MEATKTTPKNFITELLEYADDIKHSTEITGVYSSSYTRGGKYLYPPYLRKEEAIQTANHITKLGEQNTILLKALNEIKELGYANAGMGYSCAQKAEEAIAKVITADVLKIEGK